VSADAELHGTDIFQGTDDWRRVPPWLRVQAYREAADAISGVEVATFFSGIDLVALESGEDDTPAHELALRLLLESLQRYAVDRDELVLVIADEIHTAERHRTKLKSYQEHGTKVAEDSHLDRIFDTLYFGPSRHSRLLQAADLLTYIYLRRATKSEASPRAGLAVQRIWKSVASTIVVEQFYPTS
jgi:hypothetical protein